MNGNEIAIAWRDEQIAMLKSEIARLMVALDSSERRCASLEEALFNLKEEVNECLPTP